MKISDLGEKTVQIPNNSQFALRASPNYEPDHNRKVMLYIHQVL